MFHSQYFINLKINLKKFFSSSSSLETGEHISIFKGHSTSVYCLALYGGSLFSGSADKTVKKWDINVISSSLIRFWFILNFKF